MKNSYEVFLCCDDNYVTDVKRMVGAIRQGFKGGFTLQQSYRAAIQYKNIMEK